MLINAPLERETTATRILSRSRDYGVANPKGQIFDRNFGRVKTDLDIEISRNIIGQGKRQIQYPNGLTPDGFSGFSPTMGVNTLNVDPKRAFESTAENQVHLYWRKNKDRVLKYHRVSGRAEIAEGLEQICDEAMYKNDLGQICSLNIDEDAQIGNSVQTKLHVLFRRQVLKKLTNLNRDGWGLMHTLLVEGRLFFEIVYSSKDNAIIGINLLPSQNMIIINQDGIITGYRQMVEGVYTSGTTGGRNFIDFSPNQIIYVDLGLYGPGGINDPRSILEPTIKPFNQLNAIEDSITMYRIQWGSEKLVFKIDTGMMPKPKAEKHMKDQAKVLSRKVDYNTATGEVTNFGRVIGLGEHFFLSTSNQTANSTIERLDSGDNISRIEDLKYFKRNLVNSMKVPPGRITALQGDGENFSNGKIGEVTQAEVAFARMVQRYQLPMDTFLTRLFVMVLNTQPDISDDIKLEDNFNVVFNKANSFQNYMDAETLNTNLDTFKKMVDHVKSDENPAGLLSAKLALIKGLRLSDADRVDNETWLKEEAENTKNNKGTSEVSV